MELVAITPTPAALKALTHPVRLRILGLLRIEGPATATQLATRLGLNSGATSYHLRQLAQHGFITDDETRGNARDRWWRAAHQATTTAPPEPEDVAARDTLDAYVQAVATVLTEQLQRAVEERALLPDPWRRATAINDFGLRLTPARARALVDALEAAILEHPEDDDGDAADFVIQLAAFPRPGTVAGDQL
jgi:DNA-binding transcriptional ArsR family regulator